jgi:adenylate kinase family enzyme
VQRVVVTGPAGAGKTELALALGRRLELPVVHLDTLFWKPGWIPTPPDEWKDVQRRELAADAWVVDSQFDDMLPEWLERADTVVFVDASPLRCLWRVSRRRLSPEPSAGTPAGTKPAPFHRALGKFARNQWRYQRRVRRRLLDTLAEERDRKRIVVVRRRDEVDAFLRDPDSPTATRGTF